MGQPLFFKMKFGYCSGHTFSDDQEVSSFPA